MTADDLLRNYSFVPYRGYPGVEAREAVEEFVIAASRVDNRIEYGAEVIDFGAACIFGRELNLIAKAPSTLDRLHGEIESLPAGLVQLVFEMDVTRRQKCMDARMGRIL